MKPYQETAHTTAGQKTYNYRQSRARMVVENAFGRLKGRWRCLLKRMDFKLQNVPPIVSSCVVLHNICEMYGDTCREEWIDHTPPDESVPVRTIIPTGNSEAHIIRDAIMHYLNQTRS